MKNLNSEKDKCVFCNKKAEKAYSIANKMLRLCDRCELLINLLTYGLDRDCVSEGEPVDEADLPFYDFEGEKMLGGVPVDAMIPFDDIPIRDDTTVIEELIPFDNLTVNAVEDTRKTDRKARKKRKAKVTLGR